MTEDNSQQVVQAGVVPPEGTTPPAVVTPPEPSLEEKMATLIEQKVAEAVAKDSESARRAIQSAKDKATAEVDKALRRARLAEGTLSSTRSHLQSADPDVAKEMELAELRAEKQGRATLEQEEQMAKYQADVVQQFHENMTQFITGLGINPADKKIDWAGDAQDLLTMQQRILDSVSKIQKENIQTMQSGLEKRLKELEGKVQQVTTEANSVSTATSSGVIAGSDAEFVKKFGSGEIPLTKANKERYEKIQQSY